MNGTKGSPFIKDPDAVLDFSWDWSDWLSPISDTIASQTFQLSGITKDSHSQIGGVVTAFLSGGTAGALATATCRIVTAGGRTDDRTIYIRIKER